MSFQAFVFYVLSAILVFAGVRVITAKNPVHAALFLVLAFFTASGHWLLLQSEFLAISLVLVYVGAVMVLFLFVVMMLDINVDAMREGFWKNFPLALVLGGLVTAELAVVLWAGFPTLTLNSAAATAAMHAPDHSNTLELGKLLYTQYRFPIQIAAIVLLVAMITAIALTLRARKDSKAISAGIQVKVRAADRLRVVQLPATRMTAPETVTEEVKS